MIEKMYKNKKWLKQKYLNEGWSGNQIASFCGISVFPVYSRLKKYKIKIRAGGAVLSSVKRMKKWQRAYLAACVDTDGCIFVAKARKTAQVSVANKNVEFLTRIQRMVGGGRINVRKNTGVSVIVFRIREVNDILPQIIPFLVIKQEKAKKALELYKDAH